MHILEQRTYIQWAKWDLGRTRAIRSWRHQSDQLDETIAGRVGVALRSALARNEDFLEALPTDGIFRLGQ